MNISLTCCYVIDYSAQTFGHENTHTQTHRRMDDNTLSNQYNLKPAGKEQDQELFSLKFQISLRRKWETSSDKHTQQHTHGVRIINVHCKRIHVNTNTHKHMNTHSAQHGWRSLCPKNTTPTQSSPDLRRKIKVCSNFGSISAALVGFLPAHW